MVMLMRPFVHIKLANPFGAVSPSRFGSVPTGLLPVWTIGCEEGSLGIGSRMVWSAIQITYISHTHTVTSIVFGVRLEPTLRVQRSIWGKTYSRHNMCSRVVKFS